GMLARERGAPAPDRFAPRASARDEFAAGAGLGLSSGALMNYRYSVRSLNTGWVRAAHRQEASMVETHEARSSELFRLIRETLDVGRYRDEHWEEIGRASCRGRAEV